MLPVECNGNGKEITLILIQCCAYSDPYNSCYLYNVNLLNPESTNKETQALIIYIICVIRVYNR